MGLAIAPPDLGPALYQRFRRRLFPYALITPSVAVIAGILAFPLGMLVWLSLQHYGLRELIAHAGDWVGAGNYLRILADPLFHQVILRTLLFTLVCVALTVSLSTLIALLLLKVRQAVRIIVMSALVFVWTTPVIVSVDIWQWMFDYEFGVINYLLTQLHVGNFIHHNWFDDPIQGWSVFVVIVVWGAIPFVTITLFAGLLQVPSDVVDAAHVDGAGAWQRFWFVTAPMLKPIFLIVTCLSTIWDFGVFTQIYVMLATAFKPGRDILSLTPKWIPAPFTLENFTDAITRPYFLEDVKNSVIVVAVMLVLGLTVAFLAAVGTARFGFKGRTAFLVLIIGVRMWPLNALIIPLYLMLDRAGQTDALPGVIAIYLAVVLPFMIWTLRGFVANIPVELEESAMIDGCSRVGSFFRITFPLVGPGLVATAIFGFIQAWNEYIVAYVLLSSPNNQTLTIWLASFTTNHGPQWGPLMAGATLTGVPVVAFFLVLQRYLAGGLTAGAVKG